MTEQSLPSTAGQHRKQQLLIRIVAFILSAYALIEIGDCITAVLMAFGLIGNPYPTMLFSEMQALFDQQPVWLVPLFLFFTSLRVTASVGLWMNRLWGFWIALFVSVATLILAPFLLPFTSAEMLGNGILIILLLFGFFGNKPILATGERGEKW